MMPRMVDHYCDGLPGNPEALIDRDFEARVMSRRTMRKVAGQLLAGLDDRERAIVVKRFGLGGRTPKTLEQVRGEMERKVSLERIRQIEDSALRKMKRLANLAKFNAAGVLN